MTRSEIIFGIVRIPLDFLVSVGAFLLAYQLRVHSIDLLPNVQILSKEIVLPPLGTFIEFFVLPWSAVYIVILGIFGLYALRVTTSPWKELASLLLGTLLWLASIITWFALIEKQLLFSRILIIHATSFACIAAGVTRVMLILLQRSLLRRGIGTRSIISCGNLPLPMNVLQAISDDARYTYAGHLPPTSSELLKLDCLPDLVLHTDPNPESDETQDLIKDRKSTRLNSSHVSESRMPSSA